VEKDDIKTTVKNDPRFAGRLSNYLFTAGGNTTKGGFPVFHYGLI
jgi:hypothetical protein